MAFSIHPGRERFCREGPPQAADVQVATFLAPHPRPLRDAAAPTGLGLRLLDWLLESEQGRVSAGRCEEDHAAVGGHQGNAGILGARLGLKEPSGAITQVAVKQRVTQQLGRGPLPLELRKRLATLPGPGPLGWLRKCRTLRLRCRWLAVAGRRGWSRRHRGDRTVGLPAVLWSRFLGSDLAKGKGQRSPSYREALKRRGVQHCSDTAGLPQFIMSHSKDITYQHMLITIT